MVVMGIIPSCAECAPVAVGWKQRRRRQQGPAQGQCTRASRDTKHTVVPGASLVSCAVSVVEGKASGLQAGQARLLP